MVSQYYPFQISISMSSTCIAHSFQWWCNNVYQMLYQVYLGTTEENRSYLAQMNVHLEMNSITIREPATKFQPFNDFSYIIATWQEPQISSVTYVKRQC